MLSVKVASHTIIPYTNGFLYHTFALSVCLGVKLYTSPTRLLSGLGLVNILTATVTKKQITKDIQAILNAWLVPEQ